jgi:hypothetical protein
MKERGLSGRGKCSRDLERQRFVKILEKMDFGTAQLPWIAMQVLGKR